jgi:hypothetical protein
MSNMHDSLIHAETLKVQREVRQQLKFVISEKWQIYGLLR